MIKVLIVHLESNVDWTIIYMMNTMLCLKALKLKTEMLYSSLINKGMSQEQETTTTVHTG